MNSRSGSDNKSRKTLSVGSNQFKTASDALQKMMLEHPASHLAIPLFEKGSAMASAMKAINSDQM